MACLSSVFHCGFPRFSSGGSFAQTAMSEDWIAFYLQPGFAVMRWWRFLLPLALLCSPGALGAEVAWAWIGGCNTILGPRSFGTKGSFSASTAPGPLSGHRMAFANDGYLYVFFGTYCKDVNCLGEDTEARLDTVWKYNPTSKQWMWAAGSNVPGASINWGTKGSFSATATPGARSAAAIAYDGQYFWMAGGTLAGNYYMDLWAFNPSNNQWSWRAGCNVPNVVGNYGTKGSGDSATLPRSRSVRESMECAHLCSML